MKRNHRRLAVALFISTGCYAGTTIWFQAGNEQDDKGDIKPLARLNESQNEVQRKPQGRVIWESLSKNEDLYAGETIRTASNAEAKIELISSKTVIHLEGDSLVVLEESDTGLSLDFLQGNLYVAGGGATGDITLKTGSGEIKLDKADMSLSKDQSGQVNLEVYNGTAQLAQNGRTVALDKDKAAQLGANGLSVAKDRVQITAPRAGDTVLLNLIRGEKLDIAFKPLPAGYKVAAEWGTSRASLSPTGEEVDGDKGLLPISGKSGKWFVRLVAKSADANQPPLMSAVLPVTIQPKSPPQLGEPKADKPYLKEAAEAKAPFNWFNRHEYESQILEVASDAQFKSHKVKQTLNGTTTEFSADLPDGNYFWRVTGFLKVGAKTEGLTSTISKFSAQSRWEVKPPTLVWPTNQQYLPYADVQRSGINFKWQAPTGVKRFQITVSRKEAKGPQNVLEKEIETTSARLPEVKPGTYTWKVASVDPKGGDAKISAEWTFIVEEMPKIEWAQGSSEYEYPTPTPSLSARWKPLVQAPTSYRYRVTSKSGSSEGTWNSTKQTVFDIPVASEGEYEAIVEAVNAKGQTVAQSDTRVFKVKRRPLLPAPQWAQNTPEVIKSDAKGNLSLGWEEVEGANHYLMILESEDGKVIDQKEVTRTTASLNRLKPGQYKVKLKSVDSLKRPGVESAAKPVVVPSLSDIRAPKIKQMKVK